MLLDFVAPFKRLRAALPIRQQACPSSAPDCPCPLLHPLAPLPAWVEADPVVAKYRALLGSLPWADFPERPTDRAFPGPDPTRAHPSPPPS
jgi:hypothetical protein